MTKPIITINELDAERLDALLEQPAFAHTDIAAALNDELDRAEILPPAQIPANVVTMNSIVRFRDLHTGEEHVRTLVYPASLKDSNQQLSVMAPLAQRCWACTSANRLPGRCRTANRRILRCWNCCTNRKPPASIIAKRRDGRPSAARTVTAASTPAPEPAARHRPAHAAHRPSSAARNGRTPCPTCRTAPARPASPD
ncbi:Regulator of nucleoside diphosphate kinase [Serratia rubidaea]|uniref:Regulator of nucleoside diphosphate kinase n=1 Tax=Serratia rubidaea TaxID=61652 RepID=A0A3S4GIM6_SERRU|nr:Regulator of nucleoside diphosphate kinase [Serratia rubidaea]